MRTATPTRDTATRSANAIHIDLAEPVVDVADVRAALDMLASDLRSLWSSAIAHGDFDEITRVVEASHAIHRAAIALRADSLIPTW